MKTKEDYEKRLAETADTLDAALPDLFDAMIAAGRGPTDEELELFRQVKGTGSNNEWRKLFAKHARSKGSLLLAEHLPTEPTS
ncbi:hypothetical protein [Ensifer sp. ENS03]|uniref:hypothetical protein n=1 Tax=Ensifer sp. ENS03 TaxID=2769283 RepID=UPI000B5B5064|nr:hypothetical protein [Ensifer sp. ENS03]MBD9560587.1 hypothetical protein [Ensifer sp. ENS03]OWZ90527.1 hypothetical protein B9J07_27175 [Sinorhizobium sp. LM21]